MRHKNPNQHAKLGAIIPILAILIPLAGLGAAAWTLPADLIPLPKQSRTCMVTGGGTLRIHTND